MTKTPRIHRVTADAGRVYDPPMRTALLVALWVTFVLVWLALFLLAGAYLNG